MNFKNHFLISMPHLVDSFFSKSIIFMCEHEENGAMGIIINKNLSSKKSNLIINEMGLNSLSPNPDVFLGGPV